MVPDHWMVISQKYFFNLQQPINYKLLSMNNMDEIMFHDMHDYKHAQRLGFQRFQMDKSQVGRFITVGQQIISSRLMVIKTRRMTLIRMVINGYKGKRKWGASVGPGIEGRRGGWMLALAWMIKYHSWLVTLTTSWLHLLYLWQEPFPVGHQTFLGLEHLLEVLKDGRLKAGVSICSENLIFSFPTFWPN